MAGRFKKYPTPPRAKTGLPRPPTIKIQHEHLLETNDNDDEYQEEEQQQQQQYEKYWRPASLRTLVWVNFVLVCLIILFLFIYIVIHKTAKTPEERKGGEEKESKPFVEDIGRKNVVFNLVPHEESNQRWMILPLKIPKPTHLFVCCTKDNLFFCSVDATLSLTLNEVRIIISHPDKIGASCVLNWI